MKKELPNGFESWHETHYEIVAAINQEMNKHNPTGTVKERHDAQGRGGLYELAQELTDEFEKLYKNFEWDGEFFDEIDNFIQIKLYTPNMKYKPLKKQQ